MPARIDATPMAITGQPATAARYTPNSAATANAAAIASFIAAGEIQPDDTARAGPLRLGPSAPRSASKTSFAKLVPICSANAPPSAASAGPQAMPPEACAAAVPTTTGAAAAVSVRGRAARSHARARLGPVPIVDIALVIGHVLYRVRGAPSRDDGQGNRLNLL